MEQRNLKPGDIVRHFKRELQPADSTMYLYEIIDFAHHSETDETLVVYKALYPPYKSCARPYDMFMGEVDRQKYPEITQKYRFEKLMEGHELISWFKEKGLLEENFRTSREMLSEEGCKKILPLAVKELGL